MCAERSRADTAAVKCTARWQLTAELPASQPASQLEEPKAHLVLPARSISSRAAHTAAASGIQEMQRGCYLTLPRPRLQLRLQLQPLPALEKQAQNHHIHTLPGGWLQASRFRRRRRRHFSGRLTHLLLRSHAHEHTKLEEATATAAEDEEEGEENFLPFNVYKR